MKYLIAFLIVTVIATQGFIIKVQADNNKQLIYDLNVSQTAFKIQQQQFKDGLCICLPRLEMK